MTKKPDKKKKKSEEQKKSDEQVEELLLDELEQVSGGAGRLEPYVPEPYVPIKN